MFKNSTEVTESEKHLQFYQCCDKHLGIAIIKEHADVLSLSERELLSMIKQLAVISVSVVVRQSEFPSTRQDLTENTRSFAART